MSEEFVKPKNKGGRPRKYVPKSGVTRDTRVPINGDRDILTVTDKDPNFHYSLPADTDENGAEIQKMLRAGYQFVQAGRQETVGEVNVYRSTQHGSIMRVPAGAGKYHYLMKIPMQWHLEDMEALEKENKALEQSLGEVGEGQYLKEFKITRNKNSNG